MKHGDIYEEKLEINEEYDDYNEEYDDYVEDYNKDYKELNKTKNNTETYNDENHAKIKYEGNPILGILIFTFFSLLKSAIFFISARIILSVLIEMFGAPIKTVFFLSLIGLSLLDFVVFTANHLVTSRCATPMLGVKVYGNAKTIYFNLYFYLVWIATIIVGYNTYNEIVLSSIPDLEKISELYIFYALLSFSFSLNTSKINFKFWACPKCKRGYMMEKVDVELRKTYERAEFETVGGEFVRSNNTSTVHYATGYEPSRQEFKGVYKYSDYSLNYQCIYCDHEKFIEHQEKERIL